MTIDSRVMGLNDPMTGERGMVVIVEDERTIAELERLYLTQAGNLGSKDTQIHDLAGGEPQEFDVRG